jgi:hypothetical protein
VSSVDERPGLPPTELEVLEERLQEAFLTGDASHLAVIGYGEISCVVAHSVGDARYACKRLPEFGTQEAFDRYRKLFDEYLVALREGGVEPVASALQVVDGAREGIVAWCIQPLLDADGLLPKRMRAAERDEAVELFERILAGIRGTAGPELGLDGQLSNWVMQDDELRYLDVTTPLMRDASGADRLDADLFLASLPWALRSPVKRFVLTGIIDKYHRPRGVTLDLLGNLIKERLDLFLDPFLEVANASFDWDPITVSEVRRYYADDARTWAMLQWARRLDRGWHRRVRKRPYPFLLPGRIER